MSQAAHRYAEAFFELAQEMNQIDAWKLQMDQVALVMESVPELKGFFGAVKITNEEKKELLIKSFEGKIDEMCLNFLCLLTDKKRISEVSLVLKEFHSLCNAYKGIEEGVVYAPRGICYRREDKGHQLLHHADTPMEELRGSVAFGG